MDFNPFSAIAAIAENRIQEAILAGEFDNLPGAGKPLTLEDLSDVPEESRLAYKILKNSGCLPPEVAHRKDAANCLELLANCPDEKQRLAAMRKLRLLLAKMGENRNAALEANDDYYQKILGRLEKYERMNKISRDNSNDNV